MDFSPCPLLVKRGDTASTASAPCFWLARLSRYWTGNWSLTQEVVNSRYTRGLSEMSVLKELAEACSKADDSRAAEIDKFRTVRFVGRPAKCDEGVIGLTIADRTIRVAKDDVLAAKKIRKGLFAVEVSKDAFVHQTQTKVFRADDKGNGTTSPADSCWAEADAAWQKEIDAGESEETADSEWQRVFAKCDRVWGGSIPFPEIPWLPPDLPAPPGPDDPPDWMVRYAIRYMINLWAKGRSPI